jgi:hypothetical protein
MATIASSSSSINAIGHNTLNLRDLSFTLSDLSFKGVHINIKKGYRDVTPCNFAYSY